MPTKATTKSHESTRARELERKKKLGPKRGLLNCIQCCNWPNRAEASCCCKPSLDQVSSSCVLWPTTTYLTSSFVCFVFFLSIMHSFNRPPSRLIRSVEVAAAAVTRIQEGHFIKFDQASSCTSFHLLVCLTTFDMVKSSLASHCLVNRVASRRTGRF